MATSILCGVHAADQVRVAAPAPSFEVKDLDGQLVPSTNFNDKVLIVFFWITTDEPCQKQLSVLLELQKDFSGKEFTVIGMALDPGGLPAIKLFAQQHKVTFPNLIADYKVIKDFGGLNAVPTLFVIDKRRNIIHKRLGFTDKAVLEDDLKAILKR